MCGSSNPVLNEVTTWAAGIILPAAQVVTSFKTGFEDPHIWRRGRVRMLRIHADQRTGLPSELLARVKPKIEQALGVDVRAVTGSDVAPEDWDVNTIKVVDEGRYPIAGMPGYSIAWGGEVEDSARAMSALAGSIPRYPRLRRGIRLQRRQHRDLSGWQHDPA